MAPLPEWGRPTTPEDHVETRTWHNPTLDRTDWAAGPWDTEPDKIQYQDEATGYPCLIVRNRYGALCGYTGIPDTHPWHGHDYTDLPAQIEVHGGLTFAGPCHDHPDEGRGICHIAAPGEPDNVWWYGYDCAHHLDIAPGMDATLRTIGAAPETRPMRSGEAYRDVTYVKAQNALLAAQLHGHAA